MNGDLELAAGRLVDIGDELRDVLCVEIACGVGGRQVLTNCEQVGVKRADVRRLRAD